MHLVILYSRQVSLTFEPGQVELQMAVTIQEDELPEDTESFTVELVNPGGGAELGQMSAIRVSILSNDDAHGIIEFGEVKRNIFYYMLTILFEL